MNEENVKKLFSLMFGNRDSSFFVIEGIKEIGKTSLLLWFMEQGYKLDYWKGSVSYTHLTLPTTPYV